MKKILSIATAIIMLFLLAACDKIDLSSNSNVVSSTEQQKSNVFMLPSSSETEQLDGSTIKVDYEWSGTEYHSYHSFNNSDDYVKMHSIYDKETKTLTTHIEKEESGQKSEHQTEFIFNEDNYIVGGTTYRGDSFTVEWSNGYKTLTYKCGDIVAKGDVLESGIDFKIEYEDIYDKTYVELNYDYSDLHNIIINETSERTKATGSGNMGEFPQFQAKNDSGEKQSNVTLDFGGLEFEKFDPENFQDSDSLNENTENNEITHSTERVTTNNQVKYCISADENEGISTIDIERSSFQQSVKVTSSKQRLIHPWQTILWLYMEPNDIFANNYYSIAHAIALTEISR